MPVGPTGILPGGPVGWFVFRSVWWLAAAKSASANGRRGRPPAPQAGCLCYGGAPAPRKSDQVILVGILNTSAGLIFGHARLEEVFLLPQKDNFIQPGERIRL